MKNMTRWMAAAVFTAGVAVQAEVPAAAPIAKGGAVSVSEAQTKSQGLKASLDSWLKDLRRRVARTRAHQNQVVAVAAVRGAEAADAPPLYWKGKKNSGPVDAMELDQFEKAVEAAIGGKPEARGLLQSFVSDHPKSSLAGDATTALAKLDAAATAP